MSKKKIRVIHPALGCTLTANLDDVPEHRREELGNWLVKYGQAVKDNPLWGFSPFGDDPKALKEQDDAAFQNRANLYEALGKPINWNPSMSDVDERDEPLWRILYLLREEQVPYRLSRDRSTIPNRNA